MAVMPRDQRSHFGMRCRVRLPDGSVVRTGHLPPLHHHHGTQHEQQDNDRDQQTDKNNE